MPAQTVHLGAARRTLVGRRIGADHLPVGDGVAEVVGSRDGEARCGQGLRRVVERLVFLGEDLRDRLQRPSGEVIFTTIQKLLPERESDRNPRLSDRHNIVVIADEAHRTT